MFGPALHQILDTVERLAAAAHLPFGTCGIGMLLLVGVVVGLVSLGARVRRGSVPR